MPVDHRNLTTSLDTMLSKDYIIVQYPFVPLKVLTFASIFLFFGLKITKVRAVVVNPSTTLITVSVIVPPNIITVEIKAGEGMSNIWEGEIIVKKNSIISFRINTEGTGGFLTVIVEGEYQWNE